MTSLAPGPSGERAELEWAAAGRALDGATSGDLHLVLPGAPRSLLCVMDGLGHGGDARRAALECALILETHGAEELLDLVRYCHEGLRATRGVAMTLALLDTATTVLDWVCVGNVEGLVLRPGSPRRGTYAAVVQRGGVVGYQLPPLKVSHVALAPGDVIVLATDGIRGGFHESLDLAASAPELADDIVRRYAKTSDDALALVVRYRGGGAE
jgi:negative regulator of sigma-B (phosphoserine phosphatase)